MTEDMSAVSKRCDWASQILSHRRIWEQKKILRALYHSWFRRIKDSCLPGRTLEVGGGSGNFKEFWPKLISSDIVFTPWLDLQADCHSLPFPDGIFDNVVGVDILHHLADIDQALLEMTRIVRLGGRLVFLEPFITPFSHFVNKYFTDEQVDFKDEKLFSVGKNPEYGNVALPTKIFWRERSKVTSRFPYMRLIELSPSDPIVYPLSGGFGSKNLLPELVLLWMKKIEYLLKPLHRLMAFKMLIVVEHLPENTLAKP
jgi:ubiquinone/menaquinone biosynthesis C-methylase UbiE